MSSKARLTGRVSKEIKYDKEITRANNNAPMFLTEIEIEKPNGGFDYVPVVITEDLKNELPELLKNWKVSVEGYLQSIPLEAKGKAKRVYVMASDIYVVEESTRDRNLVEFEGSITYLGEACLTSDEVPVRHISVFCGTGTIPCTCWRQNATEQLYRDRPLLVKGYMVTRYIKKFDRNSTEVIVKEVRQDG